MHKLLSNIFSQILIGQLSEELGAGCWLVLLPVEGKGELAHSALEEGKTQTKLTGAGIGAKI